AGEDLKAVKVRIFLRQSMQRQRQMHLFKVAGFDMRAALTETRGLRQRRGGPAEARKTLLDFAHDRGMIDRARSGDDHIRRPVVAREIATQPVAVEGAHGFGRSQDRSPQWLLRKSG